MDGGRRAPDPGRGRTSVDTLPARLLDELAARAATALRAVADRVPAADAELMGRTGPGAASPAPATRAGTWTIPPGPARNGSVPPVRREPDPGETLGRRVLAAVQPAPDVPAELVPFVGVPPLPASSVTAAVDRGDPTRSAVDQLRQFGPDVVPWTVAVTGALAGHPAVAPLLRVGPGAERELVVAHGRAHLALALVVAAMVVPAADPPVVGAGPAVVVGVGVEAARQVLSARPMPDGYAAALLDRRRAEYETPNHVRGAVELRGHRFGLVEGPLPADPGEPPDGLVTVVPGGLIVRTGAESGRVGVTVEVLAGRPASDDPTMHEVVEVSFTAAAGAASVVGDAGPGPAELRARTPPWPGPMRARVAARGRDDGHEERYAITVWPAPPAPPVVLAAADRLGHRLRGEPEPPVVVGPETAYRWLRGSVLADAATVTVVVGSTAEQVVEAFGGDPTDPVPVEDEMDDDVFPWAQVLAVDGAVVVVEPNGWQGRCDSALQAVSARGRAASVYWSAGVTSLAFARAGEVVDSFEPLFEHTAADPEVRAALAGIDWADFTDLIEKGLAAVQAFTGHGIGERDLERIEAAATAYYVRDWSRAQPSG
jgi:hypothetical protein